MRWWFLAAALASPADTLPAPQPERCLGFIADVDDPDSVPTGLHYNQVSAGLNAVIQTALKCPRPPGLTEVHLTFDFQITCEGLVEKLEIVDAGGAPNSYAQCIGAVIEKADFPAHDKADGMPVTYPVDVTW